MDEKIPPNDDEFPFSEEDENSPEDEFPMPISDGNEFPEFEDPYLEEPDLGKPEVTGHHHQKEHHEHHEPHHSTHNAALDKIDLSNIPIRVDLELARIKVSISELQKMQPGQKLPVNINPRIVNLVIDNKTIGRGEVVEVGDAICIKILELFT